MVKRFTIAALSIVMALPGAALAAEGDSITVNRPTLDVCDGAATTISFMVDASHATLNDRTVVTVDGDTAYGPTTDDDETFTVHSVLTRDGEHTIVASIYDDLVGDLNEEDIVAQDVYVFDIDCHRGGLALLDDENRHIYQSDQPNQGGSDCCPGPDNGSSGGDGNGSDEPTQAVKKSVPKVKGATAVKKTSNLKQLNSVFRSAYGRTPTYTEWKYWAERLTGDKQQLDALYGAMQWQKLHGRTIGA